MKEVLKVCFTVMCCTIFFALFLFRNDVSKIFTTKEVIANSYAVEKPVVVTNTTTNSSNEVVSTSEIETTIESEEVDYTFLVFADGVGFVPEIITETGNITITGSVKGNNVDFQNHQIKKGQFDGYYSYKVSSPYLSSDYTSEKFDGVFTLDGRQIEANIDVSYSLRGVTYIIRETIVSIEKKETVSEAAMIPTTIAIQPETKTENTSEVRKVIEDDTMATTQPSTGEISSEVVTTATQLEVKEESSLKILGLPIYEASNTKIESPVETAVESSVIAETTIVDIQAIAGFGTEAEIQYETQFTTASPSETLDEHGQEMLEGVLKDLRKGGN